MAGFGEYKTALKTRDIIERIARSVINRERPKYRYAKVMAIDSVNFKCDVQFPGQSTTVRVSMGTIQPSEINQTVRVAGLGNDFYIEDVIGGGVVTGLLNPPPQPTTWQNLVPGTNVSIGTGVTYNQASARLDYGGHSVQMRGELITSASIAVNTIIATVPSGLRPAKTVILPVGENGSNALRLAAISITSAGALAFLGHYSTAGGSLPSGQSLLLDGARYAVA